MRQQTEERLLVCVGGWPQVSGAQKHVRGQGRRPLELIVATLPLLVALDRHLIARAGVLCHVDLGGNAGAKLLANLVSVVPQLRGGCLLLQTQEPAQGQAPRPSWFYHLPLSKALAKNLKRIMSGRHGEAHQRQARCKQVQQRSMGGSSRLSSRFSTSKQESKSQGAILRDQKILTLSLESKRASVLSLVVAAVGILGRLCGVRVWERVAGGQPVLPSRRKLVNEKIGPSYFPNLFSRRKDPSGPSV